MKLFLIAFLIVLILAGGALLGVLHIAGRDLPDPSHLQAISAHTKTQVLDRSGRLIGEFFRENRSLVSLDAVPKPLVNAFIAVEDRRFWEHWGVSPSSVFRAVLKNVLSFRVREGGSTITQQLARNLFLSHEQTITRKIKEAVLAVRIEQGFSKEEILEMYLNQIYFGDGAYGVQSAAHRFLGKDVQDLTLAECALLAGLPRNPRGYSPRQHPDAARSRRGVVLRSMEECKFITREERGAAEAAPLNITAAPLNPDNAPYFMEMVRRELEDTFGDQMIYQEGLVVRTTLDLPLQQEMERILEMQLIKLEDRIGTKNTRARFLAGREKGEATAPAYLQGAALVADVETGGIRALAGGRSFEESKFNRVTSAMRQPGSAFKPFIYLAAIEKGYYPSYTILDEPVSYKQTHTPEPWAPQNYDHEYHGLVTLREALKRSLNVPTIKLQEEIGLDAVIDAARQTGITTPIPRVRSIALGTAEVTLLDLTYAYAVFADNGIRVEPRFLDRVEDRHGNVLREYRSQRREALPAAPVAVLNSMLASVVDSGTGANSRTMGFTLPAAGKTGTTDDYSDAWFVGYTPVTVAGVWVGYDQPHTIGRGMSGTQAALPIWTEIMISATRGQEPLPFEAADQVVTRSICVETGLPASPACPVTTTEVFLPGHVPTETCYLHRSGSDKKVRDRWDQARKKGKKGGA